MKRRIVTNTGPLIALAAADVLPVLDRLFEHVLVPSVVREELDVGHVTGLRFEEISSRCRVLEVVSAQPLSPLLQAVLDAGEGATIQLACDSGVRSVLMDERKGRKVASEVFGLDVVGTVGLLVRAKRQGAIQDVTGPIARMLARGYYLHERIVREARREAGEH